MPWLPIPDKQNATQSIFVPPLALIMKHHPTLENLESTILKRSTETPDQDDPNPSLLIASRAISAGEELFLPFEGHPMSISDLPSLQGPQTRHFEQADKIIRESQGTLNTRLNIIPKKRHSEIGMGLRLTQKVVAMYDPIVASLLPAFTNDIIKYYNKKERTTSLYLSMKNQTHASLANFGQCLDDVEYSNGKLIARRTIKQGKTIASVPLYVLWQQAMTKECTLTEEGKEECDLLERNDVSGCLGRGDSTLQFCPLSVGPIRSLTPSSSSSSSDERANAKYDWSAWNDDNKKRERLSPNMLVEVREKNLRLTRDTSYYSTCTH